MVINPDVTTLSIAIESWLADIRRCFNETNSELLPLFETYAAEAVFGRKYIDSDLDDLAPDAKILEVGAGSLLLSCQLVRAGFQVTALEPIGTEILSF